jgi:hypothetical protein
VPGRPPESIRHRGYEHACRVHGALERRSVPTTEGHHLYRGSLQQLIAELGYSSAAQYAAIRNDLQAMGCLELERRGSGRQPSLWRVRRRPTVQLWDKFIPHRPFSRRLEASQRETHAANLRAALQRLPTTRPPVAAQLRDASVRTVAGAVTWLAANLSEGQLRELGPSMCLAYATEGTPVAVAHTCGVEGLDDLVPSQAAGSWKRRADKLAELEAG